ncbi:MAG: T9SS type A sorting domain-containing protein [Saprospiraceae bacterium]|nr:T9SS type A sorting domain-containing protein [Saprospiraceae bacterium]
MKNPLSRKWYLLSSIVIGVFLLSNSGNPPDGNTGAPFDGICSNCHGGGSFQGNVTIDGIPSMIDPNTTYPVTVTIDVTSGSPSRAGFQLVAVNQSNQNVGNLSSVNGETGTSFSGGREYIDQRGAKTISGNTVSWDIEWRSPNGPNGTTVNFYFAGNMVNNNNSSSGDAVINSVFSGTIVGGGDPLIASISSKTNVSCFGEADGTATANATGGNPPYTYEWSNGSTDNPVTGLSAGNYIVTVTDNASSTATASTNITQPTLLTSIAQVTKHVTCPGGRDGSVMVNAFGGTPPYTFVYSSGSSNNLSAGMYGYTVSDSKNCQSSGNFEILQPENYTIEELQFKNPFCPNDSSGAIQVLVSGATPPYKYKWSSGETTANILNKPVGSYTITITDSKNCGTFKSYLLSSTDTIAPMLVGKNGTVYLNQAGIAVIQAKDYINILIDNCDSLPSLEINLDSLNCLNVGTRDYYLTAEDKFGNKSYDTIQITINDTIKPVINHWADTSFSYCNIMVPAFNANDACGILKFEQTGGPKAGEIFPIGLSVLTYRAEDANNNFTTAEVKVNISNPIQLSLDTSYFEKCYGDHASFTLSIKNTNHSRLLFIEQADTLQILSDTILTVVTDRPDSLKILILDTTNCQLKLDTGLVYPDSLFAIDSVIITDRIEIQAGSITMYPNNYDSIEIIDVQGNIVNKSGKDLDAGVYYVKVYFEGCIYIYGPYAIKLIIADDKSYINPVVIKPNPFTSVISISGFINGEKHDIELYNFQGNKILNYQSQDIGARLDFSEIASGPYYLLIKTGNSVQSFKIFKL